MHPHPVLTAQADITDKHPLCSNVLTILKKFMITESVSIPVSPGVVLTQNGS